MPSSKCVKSGSSRVRPVLVRDQPYNLVFPPFIFSTDPKKLQAPDEREMAEVFTVVEAISHQKLQRSIETYPSRLPVQSGYTFVEKSANLQASGTPELGGVCSAP